MSYLGEKNYSPRMNDKSIKFLEKIIKPEHIIMETGTGNSTVWFGKNGKRVVSFENREDWLEKVSSHLKKENVQNVRIYFHKEYHRKDFADLIASEDNILYDIVLHDGPNRMDKRTLIAYKIWQFVKPGGWLIVDDTHNTKYKVGVKFLNQLKWEKTDLISKNQEKKAMALRRP